MGGAWLLSVVAMYEPVSGRWLVVAVFVCHGILGYMPTIPLLIYSPTRTSEQTNSSSPHPQNQHIMMALDYPKKMMNIFINMNYET